MSKVRRLSKGIAILAFLLFTATRASSQTQHSIILSWTEVDPTAVFNVFRGTTKGGPYIQIASGLNALTYSDTTGIGGTLYFYVVQAQDTLGDLSAYSNEVSATFRTNPTPPALAAPVVK